MNFIKIVNKLKELNKYLEPKLDEVCKKVKIMIRPKVKAMVKEEVVELLEKDKRKCTVVI